MCILCVIQKWSRRIATMLPWLVIPLIGLWALSQLLPPAFRFEITSPRLACVFVLLVTLFWYEILMPKLSAWRVRRNARLRERKRSEAIELHKLKKTATRRCRNCLTPYREQNPAGGKFMCSYCGHISKRPVLDLSIPNGMGVPNPGILKDLGGKSGNVLNGKVWSDNGGLMCGQDWLDNGYWVGGSFPQKATYWRKHGGVFFGRDDHCLAEKSYSHVLIFAGRALTATLLSIMWVWRKIFRVGSSGGDASLDADRKRMGKRGENGANFQECRGEKARKKAEEKRQAKLVKEQSEEEDRKQREEVLRLVDERRRSRDEKIEVNKDRGKGSTPAKDNNNKKEAEKKRQLKKKERDRGSSKSNSDAEDLEKRPDKESERNGKSESGRRDHHRHGVETVKSFSNNIIKGAPTNNTSRGAAGTKYFDRVKGNIMSSSRAFTGHVKGAMNSVAVGREHKFNGPVNHYQTPVIRREISQPERVSGKSYFAGDDKNVNLPVHVNAQPCEAPKKTWRQLFTRSATVRPFPDSAVTDRPNGESSLEEVTSPSLSARPVTTQPYDNPINFGLPSPFPLSTNPSGSMSSKGIQMSSESKFPLNGEALPECLLEESDIFEDPCYVPDPVSLLGPVSESLDNFQLNLGFVTDMGSEKPCSIQSIPISSEVIRPSPIEAPASRLRLQDERNASSFLLKGTTNAKDVHSTSADGLCNGNENGTWQMWNTSPLGPDGLGLSGGPANWLLPDLNRSKKEEIATPLHPKTMASLFMKDEHIPSGTLSPQKVSFGSYHNGETYGNPMSGGTNDPWLPNTLFGQTLDSQDQFTLKPSGRTSQDDLTSGSPKSATNHPFELSSADRWHNVDWTLHGIGESTSNSPVRRPPVGVVYSSLDVQSIW